MNVNTNVKTRTIKYLPQANPFVRSKGSALILALFIIIVLTLLGVALTRVLSTSNETIAQEVIGTRALMAANSAMQAQLQQLFPLNATGTCPVITLPALTANYDFTTIDGLYHCKANTSCSLYFTDPATGVNYFRITSTGECGSGDFSIENSDAVLSSRTLQVEARSL